MKNLKRGISVLLISIIFLIAIPIALAHAPRETGENTSLETATVVLEPTKSLVYYNVIESANEVRYFKMGFNQGELIKFQIFKPSGQDELFLPNLVIMGPGLISNATAPSNVETISTPNTMIIEGKNSDKLEYEPFTPAALNNIIEFQINAPASGDYYLALYSDTGVGKFGMAVGYVETFTIAEIFLLPIDLLTIYIWEGQSLFLVLLPIILIVGIGLITIFLRRQKTKMPKNIFELILVIASLFLLGSGGIVAYQTILKGIAAPSLGILVSLIFIAVPVLIGLFAYRTAAKHKISLSIRTRVPLIVLGVIAVVLWSGLYVGSLLLIVTGFLPKTNITLKKRNKDENLLI